MRRERRTRQQAFAKAIAICRRVVATADWMNTELRRIDAELAASVGRLHQTIELPVVGGQEPRIPSDRDREARGRSSSEP